MLCADKKNGLNISPLGVCALLKLLLSHFKKLQMHYKFDNIIQNPFTMKFLLRSKR